MSLTYEPRKLPTDEPQWIGLDPEGKWGQPNEVAFLVKRAGLTDLFDLQMQVASLTRHIQRRDLEGPGISGLMEYLVKQFVVDWRGIVDSEGRLMEFAHEAAIDILRSYPSAAGEFASGMMMHAAQLLDEEKKGSETGLSTSLEVGAKSEPNGQSVTAKKPVSPGEHRARKGNGGATENTARM